MIHACVLGFLFGCHTPHHHARVMVQHRTIVKHEIIVKRPVIKKTIIVVRPKHKDCDGDLNCAAGISK